MSKQILAMLQGKLDDLVAYGSLDGETRRNALKEELQFYVLNFIYHHPKYSKWIMYGGSALRICHDLDRMSVDLDFEIPSTVTDSFLHELEKEIEDHFLTTYGAEPGFLTTKVTAGRGLTLKFAIDEDLQFGHSSKQVHVKVDLNHFAAPKTVTERIPINRGQLSFVIVTYNMSALMASKIAAVFLRGSRGIGEMTYKEKGRDIYDLLWYMSKKIIPNLGYLTAKTVDVRDLRALFDKLTLKMNDVSDENLTQDLLPLFINRPYIENWLKNWRESYVNFLRAYNINIVTILERITVRQDFRTDNFSFLFWYKTEDEERVRIICTISDYWIEFREGDLKTDIKPTVESKLDFTESRLSARLPTQEKLKKYATLFYRKIENYLKKNNKVVLGNGMSTKIIRMTADNLNPKEQIVLTKSALLSCELEDLLK